VRRQSQFIRIDRRTLFFFTSIVAVGAAIATSNPTKVTVGMGNLFSTSHHDEPTFYEKQARRATVFRVAGQVYFEYQLAKRKAKKLQKKLNIPEEAVDDHPEIRELWSKVNERNAIRLTEQIKSLRGFWVKVGQYLSSRADVMPVEYLRELASLTDSMPARPYSEIEATLAEELSPEELKQIVYIDPQALSTASLAQVHRARLLDGQEVVLKVQHRGIGSLMLQDMNNLKVILNMIAWSDPDLDFGPVIREWNQETKKELDFRIESENMNDVRKLLEDNNVQAIIPKVIPGLVKERVLVMEFCEGFAVRDLEKMDEYKVDRRLLLERICSAWAIQMHVGGVFNADPHSGNILVSTAASDPSTPVLLDFGLTKRLDPPIKVAFARLMHASDETDLDSLILSFEEMGLKMNRQDPFEDMAAMQRSFQETVPQTQVRQVSSEKSKDSKARMEALKEEQGIQKGQKLRNPVEAWPAELVFFGRVTNLLRGLCSRLDVRYPYLHTMASSARKTLQESVPAEERATQLIYPSCVTTETKLQRRLVEAIEDLHAQGQMVGLQVAVILQGKEAVNLAAGTLGTANSRPFKPSTLVNIFSVAKALLSTGILRLVQDGRLDLDDPVCKHWPEFDKPEITIRHVLTHQAGLANALPEDATLDTLLDWFGMRQHMEEAKPEHAPGTKTVYHYLTYCWLCGGIIEHVTGKHYDEYLDEIIDDESLDLHLGGLPSSIRHDDLASLSVLRNESQEDGPGQRDASGSEGNHQTAPKSHEQSPPASTKDPASKKEEDVDDEEKKPKFKKVLAKYRGREQLLNPSVFNMKKVREAKLPSANVHASAASLARVMDSLPLTPAMIDLARERPPVAHDTEKAALLDDSDAYFGLGFQVHEIYRKGGGEKLHSMGHAGLGGSVVLTIPEAKLTVAITTNQLDQSARARNTLLDIIFEEYGLEAPRSMKR
jgi:predicted unusual protein kinase regulating ubiquinone biosynthesis (AarF/ABC1/UbiB family)